MTVHGNRERVTSAGIPNTFRVAPASTISVRCFGSRQGSCREVIFQALDDDSQTNVVSIGDSAASATAGSARAITRGPGKALTMNWIDPYDWYVATEGDSSHGISVTAIK